MVVIEAVHETSAVVRISRLAESGIGGTMSKIEDIKKILKTNESVKSDDEGIYDNQPEMWMHFVDEDDYEKVAKEICQLFGQPAAYAKCPSCGSDNVCWNWVYAWGGDRKKYEQMNPHMLPEELLDWGHECWDCGNCFETKDKVLDGRPYELLIVREEKDGS